MTIPKITPAIHYTVLHSTFHAPSCRLRVAPGTLVLRDTTNPQASCSHDRGHAGCSLRLHKHGACKVAQCQVASCGRTCHNAGAHVRCHAYGARNEDAQNCKEAQPEEVRPRRQQRQCQLRNHSRLH